MRPSLKDVDIIVEIIFVKPNVMQAPMKNYNYARCCYWTNVHVTNKCVSQCYKKILVSTYTITHAHSR